MSLPDATLIMFAYDERPTLNLVRSVIRDARRWPNLAIWDQSKDALITRMRSVGATHFLEQGSGDVLIMVDHDIGWSAGDLEHLTRVCLDMEGVVGGVFPKRGFGLGVPIRFGQYGEFTIPDDRVVECQYVATGFIAIHRKVLEAMKETLPLTVHGHYPFFEAPTITHDDGRVENLSEDYDFCNKARKLGFGIWADLRPQLTHHGTHLYSLADSTFKPPAPGSSTTLQMKDLTRPCAVHGLADEFELWVDPDDQVVSGSLIRGEVWERPVLEALAREVRPGDRILEVGAHIGYDTVQLARWGASVVAVEPLPHLVGILRRNVELHGLTNVDIWPMAVTHDDDLRPAARMLRMWSNPGASHLLDPEDTQGIEVPVCRLPDLPGPFDVIKLDAEGAEWLICAGERSREVLRHARVLLTEYCDAQLRAVSGVSGDDYLGLIESLGFETGVDDRSELPKGSAFCNILARRREPGSVGAASALTLP
jgi:FkbM family methyltransferase